MAAQRCLAVTADDLGYCAERDRGILAAFRDGIVTGASMLVAGASAAPAAAAARAAGLPTGLHFNCTEGQALAPAACREAGLCGADGQFLGKEGYWAAAEERGGEGAWRAALAEELGAQLARFRELWGQGPAWIDGHNHAHVAPGAAEALAGPLAMADCCAVRIPREWRGTSLYRPGAGAPFLTRVAAAAPHAHRVYAAAGVGSTSAFMGLSLMPHLHRPAASSGAQNVPLGALLQEALEVLLSLPFPSPPGGLSVEWMVHPGRRCDRRAEGGLGPAGADDFAVSEDREAELALLCDPALRAILDDEGWALVPLPDAAAASEPLRLPPSPPNERLRVVLLSQLRRATGNFTTAQRIRQLLAESGCLVYALDVEAVDAARLAAFCAAEGVGAVVGIHAYRAGRSMADLPDGVATAIVLGGTDVHRDAHDPAKSKVMARALRRAKVVIAFNQPLADGSHALLEAAGAAGRVPVIRLTQSARVVPQGQSLPPGANRAGRARFDLHAALDLPKDALVALLPAGWRQVKAPLFAAAELSALHAEDPRFHLVLVGPELEADVAADVRRAGAPGSTPGVRCLEAVPREDLLDAMATAHCVLNTSASEGECNVLLEAMAAGAPVVARRNAGNAALVEDGRTGVLFDTPAQCAAAVRRLAWDGELRARLTAAAKGYVAEAHSPQAEAKTYAHVVSLLRGDGGGTRKVPEGGPGGGGDGKRARPC